MYEDGEVTYNPGIFNVFNEEHARNIILTKEGEQDTRERWVRETPYLIDLILNRVPINEKSFVLDYGCGIGRLSKELINRTGCTVIGVDMSPNMRGFAAIYVNDDRFLSCSPDLFNMLRRRINFDLAISVWVIQHCLEPEIDLSVIRDSLNGGGAMFIVNNIARAVPTMERGFINDGIDVKEVIKKVGFKEVEVGDLSTEFVPKLVNETAFWALYK